MLSTPLEKSLLKAAEDAILVDTSSLTIDEVVETIIQLVRKKRSRNKKMGFFYGMVFNRSLVFFSVSFTAMRFMGLEHFTEGAAFIAANHTSFLDPPIVAISCPEEIHFLARKTLFSHSSLFSLIRSLNSHPVSRTAADVQDL